MPVYSYKLLDDLGKVQRGVVDLPFEDVTPAIRYMERQGGTVLSMVRMSKLVSTIYRLPMALGSAPRVEVAEVLNNLSMLLSAGVPVLAGLKEITDDLRNQYLRRTLRFVATDIESGQTFSEAISRHRSVFSPLVQSMCRIGEETGKLDEMLKNAGDHLQHLEEIIGSTKRALMYPLFLMTVVIGASAFWFMVVVPQLVKLFTDMGMTLPFLTLLLIDISDFFQNYFLLFVVGMIGFIFSLITLRRYSKRVRYVSDMVLLHIPVIKGVVETSLVARISEYLGLLLAAGVGVMRTLEIIADSVGNAVYEKRLRQVRENIKVGITLSAAMRQEKAMHPFAVRMLTVGEQSGRVEEQTQYVATVYRQRLAGLVEVLGKSLEPILLVFLGGIFALVIGGLLLPIYDIISNIQ